jgi:hypothetical protein
MSDAIKAFGSSSGYLRAISGIERVNWSGII